MVVCPICETRFSDSEVSFCSNCAWDLKNDPMIAISLDRMPENVMAEWQQRREVAKKVWNDRKRLEALEAEKNFWDSCQKQGTLKAYQDYEQKYPNGEFIQHARKLRHEIEQSQNKQRKANEEKAYWNRQSKMSDKSGFEFYLKKYPQRNYAAEARKAIQQFDKQQADIRKEQEENRIADEQRFWDACQKRGTLEAYQDYEQKCPNGKFIQQARKQRHQIEQNQNKQRKANEEEKKNWIQLSKIDGKSGFENYLKRYPNGSYAADARKAIQEFDRQQAEIRKNQEGNRKAERSRQKKLKKKAGFKFTKANFKLFFIVFLVIVGVIVVGFVIQFVITHHEAIIDAIKEIISFIFTILLIIIVCKVCHFLGSDKPNYVEPSEFEEPHLNPEDYI